MKNKYVSNGSAHYCLERDMGEYPNLFVASRKRERGSERLSRQKYHERDNQLRKWREHSVIESRYSGACKK